MRRRLLEQLAQLARLQLLELVPIGRRSLKWMECRWLGPAPFLPILDRKGVPWMTGGSTEAAASAMGDWLANMTSWDFFGTLTYDPKRCRLVPGRRDGERSMPGMDVVRAHTFKWLRSGPFAIDRPVEAAVVGIERHKSDWPHLHALVKLPGGVHKGDFAGMGQWWYRQHGYARLELPKSRNDVAVYVAKYLSKDIGTNDMIFFRLRDLAVKRG